MKNSIKGKSKKKIRYAVVGLGHITQTAMLPAFKHAGKNSVLVAAFSDDPKKLKFVGKTYGIEGLYSYDQYDEVLERGEIDAVYIGLPNHLHREYSERAMNRGVHVLCEKPMAVTSEDCEAMLECAKANKVKLMIAYRLHFNPATLNAIELVKSKKLGEPRLFNSTFCYSVKEGNIRLNPRSQGGGALYDIGIYCLNEARMLFCDEPTQVIALSANGIEKKFNEVEEGFSVVLKFPRERLATFTCSFGAAPVGSFQIVGQKGDLFVENGYEYVGEMNHRLTISEKTKEKKYPQQDQFAPELLYFSDCIIRNKTPEPSGVEGLADIRVIEAIYDSLETGRVISLEAVEKAERPGLRQAIPVPAVEEPEKVDVEKPSAA